MQRINSCLWFDHEAEEAAKFYVSIFKNAEIRSITHYGEAGSKASGRPKGSVMTVSLHPLAKGARVSFNQGKPTVTDGPKIKSSEVVGGYWTLQVASREEAIQWAMRCPAADGDVLEIRQVFEMTDFPPDVKKAADSPGVRAQVAKHQAVTVPEDTVPQNSIDLGIITLVPVKKR